MSHLTYLSAKNIFMKNHLVDWNFENFLCLWAKFHSQN